MPWNLLIFPLVAGYYVLTRSYLFKFIQQRLDTQRLVFESILIGTVISLVTYALRLLFECVSPQLYQSIHTIFPFKERYTILSLSTLLIAFLFVKAGNRFLTETKFIKQSIREVGNEFELLIKSSFAEKVLLQFTLDNDKFYIAWVKELPIPSISNYVRIIPAISGFRNEEKDLVFTSHYLTVYSEYIQEGRVTDIDELKTDLVIDITNIVTVSYFDMETYERFNRIKNSSNEE